jgi:hypothetical protein
MSVLESLLSGPDQAFLDSEYPEHQVWNEGGHTCVVLSSFALVPGLDPERSDLLIRLPNGYPDTPPDMFWFQDVIARTDGESIPAIEVIESHGDRSWHRWSRHLQGGEWSSGIDDLRSYVAYIKRCLKTAAGAS